MNITITKKHFLTFVVTLLVLTSAGLVIARGGYDTRYGAEVGANYSNGFLHTEDLIVEDAIWGTSGTLIIAGNLEVEGCIKYNNATVNITIGVCV